MRKNILTFLATLVLCGVSYAQELKIGISNFKAGVGLTQQDIDGVSAIFTSYFINPSEYTLVERTQIDKLLEEQNLQQSTVTDSDIVRIGKIMNLAYIIVGDINLIMGEYNIDVRLINVEDGKVVAADGSSWVSGQSYRAVIQKVAENLSSKIQIPKKTDSSEAKQYIQLVQRAMKHRMWDVGLKNALKLNEMYPQYFATHVFVGFFLVKVGNYTDALKYLETALLKYDPDQSFHTLLNKRSIYDVPNELFIYRLLVICHAALNNKGKAFEYQRRCMEIANQYH